MAWVLAETGPRREAALRGCMICWCASCGWRRPGAGPRVRITGPELDGLACQAAADALMAITGKLGQFRGESRFTTWACKFAVFEVSAKIGRHFWRHPAGPLDAEDWDRLSDRFGADSAQEAEWRDLAAALRRAVDDTLTPAPPATLYKVLFDARRKLRSVLVANGYLRDDSPGNS